MQGRVVLGQYEVGRLLGQGSMGQVYLARPLAGGTDVVVKFMSSRIADEPRFRELFARELASMARFRHPHAVTLLGGALDDPAGPCIVMEYVPGVEFGDLLQVAGRLRAERLGRLVLPMCRALHAAHSVGLIHRDLKPANLKVTNPGTAAESVKVMDLGLAAFADRPHIALERLQGSNNIRAVGTPAYICPEQVRGDECDARGDVYSLGVVLFEALTGRLPFDDHEVRPLLQAHVSRPPPRFRELGITDVPPKVEAVVMRCLEKFPVERPQSAYDLANEFAQALGAEQPAERMGFAPATADGPATSVATESDELRIVHHFNAWMPEAIAVVKLRGFFNDHGCRVLASEPGLIRAQLGELPPPPPPKSMFSWLRKPPPVPEGADIPPVVIELNLVKIPGTANRLDITAVFRPLDGPLPDDPRWHDRVERLKTELQAYLMAGR